MLEDNTKNARRIIVNGECDRIYSGTSKRQG
jgi:hypothetical protein